MSEIFPGQRPPRCGEDNSPEPKLPKQSDQPKSLRENGRRTDHGRLHAVRNSVLSRGLLEILTRYGENPRTLRRMERELRAELKPTSALGNLFFNRFWSCVLRLILVSHLEDTGIMTDGIPSKDEIATPFLREGPIPVLVTSATNNALTDSDPKSKPLDQELLQRLSLIARYDRSASREMYRTLGFLLVMRDGGEKGLTGAIRAAAGIRSLDLEDGQNA
jgi:hypothetical protein